MNLDEAILYCKEVADDLESYQNQQGYTSYNVKRCDWVEYQRELADWLKELKELRVKFEYKRKENEELKKLLKLASKDAGNANCSTCAHSDNNCNSCLTCYNGGNWKWRYTKDIEILLSEEI